MPRSLKTVAPRLPVRKVPDAGVFMIIDSPVFDESSKFGNSSWAVHCADTSTGEMFTLLFTSNKVRDQQMLKLGQAFQSSDEPVGPCKVATVKNATNQDTWEIVDTDEQPDLRKVVAQKAGIQTG